MEGKIFSAIEPSLSQMGFEIVRVKIMRGRGEVLQIMLDRVDGTPITISDCEKASWQVSATMDVEDPMEEKYRLEISSAGLDRPLTRDKDFHNNIGKMIKLVAYQAIEGRKRFTGVIEAVNEGILLLQVTGYEKLVEINLQNIQEAAINSAPPKDKKLNSKKG